LSGVLGSVLLPKLNQVVAKNNLFEIKTSYHKITKIYAATITPPAMILLFFSKELLIIWMGDIESVNNIWILVSLIACGGLFNTYVTASYFLMLAYGWTKFTIYQNTIASIISIPLLIISVHYFGLIGGASICIASNLGYFLVSLPLIHNKLLIGELKQVYLGDILPYFIISLLSISCFKFFFPDSLFEVVNFGYILFAMLFTYLLVIVVTKEYRDILVSIVYKLRTTSFKI
jgi:O-antigen/teichoic acid export membrane protein